MLVVVWIRMNPGVALQNRVRCMKFADNSRSYRWLLQIFFGIFGGVRCLTGSKTVWFMNSSPSIFTTIFPRGPGLAGTRMSPLLIWLVIITDDGGGEWWQLELQDMQSSSQIITTNKPTPRFLQAGCPSCHPANSVKALKGRLNYDRWAASLLVRILSSLETPSLSLPNDGSFACGQWWSSCSCFLQASGDR